MNFPQSSPLRLYLWGALCLLFSIWGLLESRVSAQPLPMPANPSPADGLTASAINPVLRWTAGSDNLLLNGGFEGGLGPGWEIATEDAIPVSLTDGSPASASAYAGAVSAWVPPVRRIGQVSLIQRVHLPIAAEHVALSWAAYLRALANPISTAEFRVEVRDLEGVPLQIVFATKQFDAATFSWRRYSADLSEFRGRDVMVAFVLSTGISALGQQPALALDDVRILNVT